MSRLQSFQEVLTAAVDDIAEHGFDSVERVENWIRDLREAARRSLIDPTSLEDQLRAALAAKYRNLVDKGGVLKLNPGVQRFTIDRIKPELRSELDRRIAASASLIKLNRDEAIEKTLRRFQGWSTSIPPGGVSGETKTEIKANVRKSLAALPFEERRVIIDQGHKLTAAISEVVASNGGAIAGRWRSNWRQPGYNYRKDHKERDDVIFLVRDSWADAAGYVKKGRGGQYYDQITAPGQEPFCRCYMIWIYALRDLPEEMLTAKGRQAITAGQERASATARADDVGQPKRRPAIGYEAMRRRLARIEIVTRSE